MKKNIVFDFDHTLTTFDTIYPFLKFCNKDNFVIKNIKKTQWIFYIFLYRCKFITNDGLKSKGINLFIKGYSKNYIDNISQDFFKLIKYYDTVLTQLQFHLDRQDNIYISSASFYEYLSLLKSKYNSLKIVSSEIEYENGKVKGLKFNNYEENKLLYFQEKNIEIDLLYTDSYSDRFLAKIAKESVIVFKDGSLTKVNSYDKFCDYFNKKVNV